METKYCLYEKKGHIAFITMNRPEVGNALHGPADEEMYEIWRDFVDDMDMRVAILTGTGDKFFSTGHDLKAHDQFLKESKGPAGTPFLGKGGFGGLVGMDCWKPVVAAVNGYALAGGFELLLSCDIIIAADHAQFGLPEPRVGVMSVGGGAQRLIRQIPWRHAMAILLTGKRFTAQQMLQYGLVNEVVSSSQLMPTALQWAHELLEAAPMAVWGMKQTAYMSIGMSDQASMPLRPYWCERQAASDDRKEGIRAFAEKRKPNWQAR